ncbi:TRAP transporter substrate-binding protein DctP [Halalkalibacter oceani]|uniref:TRAP transporter substrate-binding protein DctP n=1 Tax=Halalkalibacter oceani TaxID=1653776 RepID=UPI003397E2E7
MTKTMDYTRYIRLTALLLSVSVFFVLAACSSSDESNTPDPTDGNSGETEESVTLRISTAMDLNNLQMLGFPIFQELVEANSDGRVKVEYVGGPEAIPAFNQGEAIATGAVDMAWVASSYYAEMVPEALVSNFTEFTYEEEIENGAIEYLSSLHEENNIKLIGRAAKGQYSIFLKEEVQSMEDFEGLRIRGTSTYLPLLNALGAVALSMPGEEIYSALERGLVDGTAWASFSITDLALQELIEYRVAPNFNTLDTLIIANLDNWNSIPEDLQTIIQDAAIESYYRMAEELDEHIEKENQLLEEAGVETINLPDGEEFQKLALDESWEWLGETVEDIAELEKYFRKQ